MKLKIFTLTPLDILDLTDETFEHSSSYKHSGSWRKDYNSRWFAELTEYKSAKEQERCFLTKQDDEIQKKFLRPDMILERGYNQRQSSNYGHKLRTWYVIHFIADSNVYCSLHDTAKRAFMQKSKALLEPADFANIKEESTNETI